MDVYNKRKINDFKFSKERAIEELNSIKKELEVFKEHNVIKNKVEFLELIKNIESIADIINPDTLVLLNGFIYAIRDHFFEERLAVENFDIKFKNGNKLKIPLLMRKGVGTPSYYLDIGKENIKIYNKIKADFWETEIHIDRFENVFTLKNPRKFNVSQQTFLIGYILGVIYYKDTRRKKFTEFFDYIRELYKNVHKKHK